MQGPEVFAEADAEPAADYAERLASYLATVSEINQLDLAAYVSRCRTVLDLLGRLIRADKDGKCSRADAIHSLIVPMCAEFNEFLAEQLRDGPKTFKASLPSRIVYGAFPDSITSTRAMPCLGAIRAGCRGHGRTARDAVEEIWSSPTKCQWNRK